MFPQSHSNHLFEMAKERHTEMIKEADLHRVLADQQPPARALSARTLVRSQVAWLTTMVAWLRVRPSATA